MREKKSTKSGKDEWKQSKKFSAAISLTTGYHGQDGPQPVDLTSRSPMTDLQLNAGLEMGLHQIDPNGENLVQGGL